MNSTPLSVTNYLTELAHVCKVSGYLCLDKNENIVVGCGRVGDYDLSQLGKEHPVVQAIPVLEGLLPPSLDAATVICNVHINSDHYFDIHLFNDLAGYWVLFIDTTQSAQQLQEEQQERLDADFINAKRKTGS